MYQVKKGQAEPGPFTLASPANRKFVEEGCLDVYWNNLWSPSHVKKIGGRERLQELLEGKFDLQMLDNGGASINLPCNISEYASGIAKEKRQQLRWIASPLMWRE